MYSRQRFEIGNEKNTHSHHFYLNLRSLASAIRQREQTEVMSGIKEIKQSLFANDTISYMANLRGIQTHQKN